MKKSSCVLSDKMSFEVFAPMWSHVNKNDKEIRKNPKFEILPIFIQLWLRSSLEVCMNFFEWICYVLSEEMFDFFFLWYGPMLTIIKNQKCTILQNRKKWSGNMVKRYLSTKFDINLFDGFWENWFYGWWMPAWRQ